MTDFSDVVKRYREMRGLSLRGLAEAAHYDQGTLSKILTGKRRVTPYVARLLDDALSAGGEIIAAGREQPIATAPGAPITPAITREDTSQAPGLPVALLVQASASQAAQLTVSAGRGLLDPLAVEQLYDEIRRLSVIYASSSAGVDRQVLEEASALRNTLQNLASAYRNAAQSADLYLMIGLLSGICSYACLDLGFPDQAHVQARSAQLMGDLAGHDGLRAWALGTRSLIARFQGRYREALDFARQGLPYATCGTALVRLRCGEGQSLASLGDADGTVRSLSLAKDARDQVRTADVADGLFTFTEAKQTYYSGSSLQWLPGVKNARAAEAESARAIQMFRADPESHALGDELLAHVYLGNARLTMGEVDGSLEALRPVLDLPAAERNSWQRKRMVQIASRLSAGDLSDSALAIAAREEISSFIAPTESAGPVA